MNNHFFVNDFKLYTPPEQMVMAVSRQHQIEPVFCTGGIQFEVGGEVVSQLVRVTESTWRRNGSEWTFLRLQSADSQGGESSFSISTRAMARPFRRAVPAETMWSISKAPWGRFAGRACQT